jgi:hypothetical protein
VTESAGYPRSAGQIEILYCWGNQGRNRLDTATGTITKDLLADPPVTARFELLDEDRDSIVRFADSVGFWRLPDRIAVPDSVRSLRLIDPCTNHLLRIVGVFRSKTVIWDTCTDSPIEQRDRVAPLGELIQRIVEASETWQSLPQVRQPEVSY